MSQLLVAQRALTVPGWVKNELWRRAQAAPSLDLRFADNKSLVDAVTGQQLVTHTRASSGTFVGSNGVIQTATTNLLLQSEDFSTTWTRTGGGTGIAPVVTTNQAIAPDGTLTADRVVFDLNGGTTGTDTSNLNSLGIPRLAGASYTMSVWVKSATASTYTMRLDPASGAGSNFTAEPNIWKRVTSTYTQGVDQTTSALIRLRGAQGQSGFADVYLWGAQLEQASSAGEYIPTTSTINSAPRFDHNPTTGESLGLLVEEQRTNLALSSGDALAGGTGAVVVADQTTAPDGSLADLVREDTSGSEHYAGDRNIAVTSGVTYCWSFFAKASNSGSARRAYVRAALQGAAGVIFDVVTGASNIISSTALVSHGNQNVGNGWWRFWIVFTATGTGTAVFRQQLSVGTSPVYTGDGVSGLFIWGAQLEAGAFPTSYIPTTAAAVTRSADVCSISGSSFSGWYQQDEGTVFAEYSRNSDKAPGNQIPFMVSDGTGANIIAITDGANGTSDRVLISAGNVSQMNTGSVNYTANQVLARSIGYKLNNCATAVNGGNLVVDTSATIPVVNQLSIGHAPYFSTSRVNGTIHRLTYWPQRLPDSTLQAVTQ